MNQNFLFDTELARIKSLLYGPQSDELIANIISNYASQHICRCAAAFRAGTLKDQSTLHQEADYRRKGNQIES